MIAATLIPLILCVLPISFLVRNYYVYSERIRMIDIVYRQPDWKYYSRLRNSVGYHSMMMCFWIWPVHRMWPAELQRLRKTTS